MRMFLFLLCLTICAAAQAASGLPVPRFVSLRSDQINLRMGPGTRYPIKWLYQKSDLPVEIIDEHENWRKIRDFNGQKGWVHQQMLSGRRMVRLKEDALVLRAAAPDSLPIARAEKGAVGKLKLCPPAVALCLVDFNELEGWVAKPKLFGVYATETLE